MDGVALCARFSIATNRLAYCGPADAEPALYSAIVTGQGSPRARAALARFEALMPYLEAIGAANGLDPFDADVVRAYWIGNDLLRAVDRRRFLELLTALTRRGLPPSIARRLADHLPAEPLAHHAFHVGFVGVGAVTGHVPTTLPNIEACRPAWADVVGTSPDHLVVEGPSVREEGGGLALDGRARRSLAYDPRVLPGIAVGSRVAVHWSWPALELDDVGARDLETWTRRAIASANEALPRLGVDLAARGSNPAGATSRR
jgi:hypothetical protein